MKIWKKNIKKTNNPGNLKFYFKLIFEVNLILNIIILIYQTKLNCF